MRIVYAVWISHVNWCRDCSRMFSVISESTSLFSSFVLEMLFHTHSMASKQQRKYHVTTWSLVTLRLVSGFYTIGFGRWCMVGRRLITQHSYHGELWLHCLKCGRFFFPDRRQRPELQGHFGEISYTKQPIRQSNNHPPQKKKTSQQIATNQRKATPTNQAALPP